MPTDFFVSPTFFTSLFLSIGIAQSFHPHLCYRIPDTPHPLIVLPISSVVASNVSRVSTFPVPHSVVIAYYNQ